MENSNVFHRRIDQIPLKAVRAEGVLIYDENDKCYIDASGGPITVNVGHGRQEVAKAISHQAQKLAYVHGPMFTSDPVEKLAHRLVGHTGRGIDRYYFCSSGCEAVETAIKLARQIQISRNESTRYRVISRWQSFHGSTLGALSVTGKTCMREPYAPMLSDGIHIPAPYCLRCHYALRYPDCGLRCAYALDDIIRQQGPGTLSAFLAETICGSTIGTCVPPGKYYEIISEICTHHGLLLILDEVMCGMGRTGKWFGMHHYKVEPDIITLGKGLNGGYVPLAAVGCKSQHISLIKGTLGNFNHGHTFSHHSVAAACGLAIIDILEKENLVHQAHLRGLYLEKKLKSLENHPRVIQTRGIGLMWAVEVVKDKKTFEPFSPKEKISDRLFDMLFKMGFITYKCSGFAGGAGDAIMVGPPFIISEADLDATVDAIKTVLDQL
jgi:adenosylmethionine-8-amino-7-oxononanoate aminotransferase